MFEVGTRGLAQAEVFSVPSAGGEITPLHHSRLHSRVVYDAEQDVDGLCELYVVPIAGGPVNKLNGPMVAGGNVDRALIRADGRRVVYRADQDRDDVRELYTSPLPPVVAIDVRPGEDPNVIHPGSRGLVRLAVLGSDDFDVTDVDPATPDPAYERRRKRSGRSFRPRMMKLGA